MDSITKSSNSFSVRLTRALIRFFKLWALLVILIAAIFSYHIIIKPQRTAIFVKREQETERVLQEIRVQTIQLESYKESLKGFELLQGQNREDMLRALPEIGEKDMLLPVFQAIARDEGLFVTNLKIGSPRLMGDYFPEAPPIELPVVAVPVHLELGGGASTYESLKKLIYSLYNKFRIINLKSIHIGGGEGTGFLLDIDVFFFDSEEGGQDV